MGLESFATLANGRPVFNPSYYRKAEAYLRRCQRRVARRKKGGHRLRKAMALLAKAHQQVRNMVQNHSLAKSISDAGWSAFLSILTFKAASAGKRVQAVNPAFTSQACSACGAVVSKGLSVRWHSCPDCG